MCWYLKGDQAPWILYGPCILRQKKTKQRKAKKIQQSTNKWNKKGVPLSVSLTNDPSIDFVIGGDANENTLAAIAKCREFILKESLDCFSSG